MLAGCRHPDPRVALKGLWADLTTPTLPPPLDGGERAAVAVRNPGMYVPRVDYLNLWQWTSFYDTGPLRATLEKHVDFDKLRPANFELPAAEQAPRLILTATNLASGKLDRFDSSEMKLTPAHVAASGSLPPSFPMTTAWRRPRRAAETPYWDGGLFDNTPLSKVIGALEDDEDPDKTMYVVNLFPSEAPLPQNIPEVVTRMMTLAFSNQTEKDLRRARQTTDIIKLVEELERLMPQHPELQPLAQHPGYLAVKQLRAPIRIIQITNTDVTGPSDFSAKAIEDRRRRGYAAAETAVQLPGS